MSGESHTVKFDVTTEALGHKYTWEITLAPTKDTAGTLVGTCANGHVTEISLLSLDDYDYGTPEHVVMPDCENTGIDRYTYTTVDGQKITFDVTTDALGHDWNVWTVIAPTLTEKGSATRTCKRDDCTASQTEELPAMGEYDYGTPDHIVMPDCENTGTDRYSYTFVIDGKSHTVTFDIETEALEHDFGEWEISYPTSSATGLLSRECSRCKGTQTHTLPLLDDDNYDVTYELPTCTEKGYKTYTYNYMGETFEIATFEIPATGHSYGEWTLTLAPTKSASGTLTKECSECGDIQTHTLPALNELLYDYTLVAAATCTEAGSETYAYTLGTQRFTFTEVIPAKGHSYGEWTVATAPTASAAGELQRACANDPTHVEKQALPALNANDYGYSLVSAPLCESNGTAKYSYTYGGKTFDFEVTIPALGHSFGEWTVSVAPTATTAGELVRTCKNNAEHKETRYIPSFNEGADAYTGKVIKEPTATEPGTMLYTYVFEGITFEFTVEIPATGEAEPESGFPWWILLIIILVLLIVPAIVLLIIFLIKRKNGNTPPPAAPVEPTAPIEEAPIVVAPVEEKTTEEAPIVEAPIEEAPTAQMKPPVVVATMKRNGKMAIVNIGMLNTVFADGETVSLEALKDKGIVPKSAERCKVLADGELNKALIVKADEFSPAAMSKILAAGGQTEKIRI